MNMQPHQLIEQGVQQAEIGNLETAKYSFETALNIYRDFKLINYPTVGLARQG